MRGYTQQNKKRRSTLSTSSSGAVGSDRNARKNRAFREGVTKEALVKAKVSTRNKPSRLCNDSLELLEKHLASCKKTTNRYKCNVCGEYCCWKCSICQKFMCCLNGRGGWNGASCAVKFHNANFFGLALCDFKMHPGMKRDNWKPPSETKQRQNRRHVQSLMKEINEDGSSDE